MSESAKALNGEGPRPKDPYVRIVWAMKRGIGTKLSPQECFEMAFDSAIETKAANVTLGLLTP